MATVEELSAALVKADAAGNTADAKVFADALRAMKGQASPQVTALSGTAPQRDPNASIVPSSNIENRLPQETSRSSNPLMDLLGSTAATANGIVNGIPVLGPLTTNVSDAIGGTISQLTGGDYGKYVDRVRGNREALRRDYPVADIAGNIGGGIGAFGGLGATKAGAEAIGLTGGLWKQMTNSLLSTQGLGTLDNMARGQAPTEAAGNAATGSIISGLVPGASASLRAGGRAIRDNVISPVLSAVNPENAATRAVTRGIAQDAATAPALTQAGEAAVTGVGADVVNADRFGSAIRTLARTAANVSPEADNVLRGVVDDRFTTQANRAVDFVKRLMGGATDDLELQDTLRATAQTSNNVAYDAARANPNSRAIWNTPIKELMQSDSFRSAIKAAESRGTDQAAASGAKAVRNPFEFRPDGSVTLRANPDGSRALPSLDFWDQVKRNLDGQIGVAQSDGDKTLAGVLLALKRKLTGALDAAVPEYQKARQGAAAFFGADDAVEAGRNAATATRQTEEIRRGVAAMTQAEKDAFSVGYSSELIDKINAAKDRVNVINNVFGSPEAREKIAIALGPQKARELEAYVKAEQALHLLKDAIGGNSTTARQLIQAGVLPIAGFGAGWLGSGGDLGSAGSTALLVTMARSGAKALGRATDEKVMKQVAEMLSSGDPAKVQRAIQNASLSKQHMDALDAIMRGLNIAARGGAVGAGAAMATQPAQGQPLEITVGY